MDADTHMLHLLERAASELKKTQQQLEDEQTAHEATREALLALQVQQNELELMQTALRPTTSVEEKTSVTVSLSSLQLEARIAELEAELRASKAPPEPSVEHKDNDTGTDALPSLATAPPADEDSASDDGERTTLEQRATTAEARVGELTLSLKALKGDHYGLKQRHEDLQQKLSAFEASQNALLSDKEALETQRQELEQELAHAETQRATAALAAESLEARLKTAEEEHAEALEATRRLAEDEMSALKAKLESESTQLAAAHEKEQSLAQKLLETRSKVRELEAVLATAQQQLAAEHEESTRRWQSMEQQAAVQLAAVNQQLDAMTAQAAHADAEFRHADAQYAQLHREMLLVLDQRDEALRQLAALGVPRSNLS